MTTYYGISSGTCLKTPCSSNLAFPESYWYCLQAMKGVVIKREWHGVPQVKAAPLA